MSFYTFCDKIGSKIYHRWVDAEGNRHREVVTGFPIELFMKGNGAARSLFGEQLKRIQLTTIAEAEDFIDRYEGIDIYGQTSLAHQFLSFKYPGQINFNMKHYRILNFDIETRFDGYDPWDEIRVKLGDEEWVTTVENIPNLHKNTKVWDKYNERWYGIDNELPMLRPGGFPDPEQADYEITSISCKIFGKKTKVTFALKDFTGAPDPNRMFVKCESEQRLLIEFLSYLRTVDPDALTGWNIDGFDVPYIVNRLKRILPGQEARLSPFHAETSAKNCVRPYNYKEFEMTSYRILGLPTLDYMLLYQRFSGKKQEQYSLDFVSEAELNEKKLDYSEFDDDLMEMYLRGFNKYIEYNERDVELVERLDQKVQLIRLALTMVMMTKTRYQEMYGKVKLWDNLIYNMLGGDLIIPPDKRQASSGTIKGAWVKDPVAGKYRWVCSLDLTSLYPSICMMYNMSPETLRREADHDPMGFMERLFNGEDLCSEPRSLGLTCTANGAWFSQESEGILPRAMKYVFDTRQTNKKLMLQTKKEKETYLKNGGSADDEKAHEYDNLIAAYDATQGAMKVLANSGYGASANNSFRYYNRNIAEGITITGQLTIRYIIKKMNAFLNDRYGTKDRDYVIAADTDSAYLTLDNEPSDPSNIEQSVDELNNFILNEFQPFIAMAFERLGTRLGAKVQLMDMKKEAIASTAVWRAKKNYILLVHDMEGVRYATPQVKVTGVEAVKGATPKHCREQLKVCYEQILKGDKAGFDKSIKDFREVYMGLTPAQQAKTLSVSNVEDTKAYNAKAAWLHNQLLMKLNLQRKYPRIRNGAKIKLFHLKTPNPLRNNYIAFQGSIPEEFELSKYLDAEGQFKSVFLDPIESFATLVGWSVNPPRATLAGLFG